MFIDGATDDDLTKPELHTHSEASDIGLGLANLIDDSSDDGLIILEHNIIDNFSDIDFALDSLIYDSNNTESGS